MNNYTPLLPNETYHMAQRAVGNEKLFIEEENYRFFLQQYTKYISPYMHTIAYCLLPNHFHFVVRTKTLDELAIIYQKKFLNKEWKEDCCSALLMQQWSNLLNSYAKSFNKKYNRKGSLFIDYIKRVLITSEAQFCETVFYTHSSPVHHNYREQMHEWRHSSYRAYIQSTADILLTKEITFEYFDDLEDFTLYHQRPIILRDGST